MSGSPESRASGFAIGIDVGGTKIAGGLVSFPDGKVHARVQIPTGPERGGTAVFDDVYRLCNNLISSAGPHRGKIQGIGIGLCELVDAEGNIASENCIRWKSIPVREKLAALAPAVVEADVRAAALAEAVFGAGKSYKQFLYITIGTGISCCLMLDGKPFLGARGLTGTMASSPLSFRCMDCGHLNDQTLEQIASGPALAQQFNKYSTDRTVTAKEVFNFAAGGNAAALEVLKNSSHSLGAGVGWLVNVLDPEAVVVGGGVGLVGGTFWESLAQSTRQHIWSELNRDLPIVRAETGPDAGVIGAAAAWWISAGGATCL